jgi:hypothetical protein
MADARHLGGEEVLALLLPPADALSRAMAHYARGVAFTCGDGRGAALDT